MKIGGEPGRHQQRRRDQRQQLAVARAHCVSWPGLERPSRGPRRRRCERSLWSVNVARRAAGRLLQGDAGVDVPVSKGRIPSGSSYGRPLKRVTTSRRDSSTPTKKTARREPEGRRARPMTQPSEDQLARRRTTAGARGAAPARRRVRAAARCVGCARGRTADRATVPTLGTRPRPRRSRGVAPSDASSRRQRAWALRALTP